MRSVVFITFPGALGLDITGPLEVFAGASQLMAVSGVASGAYDICVAAREQGPVAMSSGLVIAATTALSAIRSPIDTLIVGGGFQIDALRDLELISELRRLAPHVRRLASVCTGAFALAEAGLLSGRRVTTHWRWAAELRNRYGLEVDEEAIFVQDGGVWTSAGVTAGMDLALAMIEQDHGLDVALDIARHMVMFMKRPGGQSQLSSVLRSQHIERAPLRELLVWIAEHLDQDLSVDALAARVAMSPRNFARAFVQSAGVTPARLVERMRVEAAKRELELGKDSLETISQHCGFGAVETMRRAFARQLGVLPNAYRRKLESSSEELRPDSSDATREHAPRKSSSGAG